MLNTFLKMSREYQLLLIICVVVIIVAIFVPRTNPLLRATVSGQIGNLQGSVNLETFEGKGDNSPAMAVFYAPWCPHCKNLMPELEKVMKNNISKYRIVLIDSTTPEGKLLTEKHNVQGFPTMRLYRAGLADSENYEDYNGGPLLVLFYHTVNLY